MYTCRTTAALKIGAAKLQLQSAVCVCMAADYRRPLDDL